MAELDTTSAVAERSQEPPAAAFEAILAEIEALPESEVVQVNVDPIAAATSVLGCLPELRALRPHIERALPLFDLAQFDKLEQYALAFSHAHGLYRSANVPKGQITELANELIAIRDRLHFDAMSLANNGFFSASRLDQCKKTTGYRALATDVLTLVPLFKEHWAKVANRTPVTLEALADAARRAVAFMEVLGMREQGPEVVGEAALTRAKAFTLFLRAYDEARHAIAYVRRNEGDAGEIAPSLYTNRGNRRRDGEVSDGALDGESSAPAEAARATAKPAEAGPAPTSPDAPLEIQINNPKGLPIDNPFTAN